MHFSRLRMQKVLVLCLHDIYIYILFFFNFSVGTDFVLRLLRFSVIFLRQYFYFEGHIQ